MDIPLTDDPEGQKQIIYLEIGYSAFELLNKLLTLEQEKSLKNILGDDDKEVVKKHTYVDSLLKRLGQDELLSAYEGLTLLAEYSSKRGDEGDEDLTKYFQVCRDVLEERYMKKNLN